MYVCFNSYQLHVKLSRQIELKKLVLFEIILEMDCFFVCLSIQLTDILGNSKINTSQFKAALNKKTTLNKNQ